jgi:putative metalloenzyme radical SAM/SPASM domain maturase
VIAPDAVASRPGPEAPPARRLYPSRLFAEVTTRCNLRCAMCVKQTPGQAIVDGDMSAATFERLGPSFPHLEALVLNGIGEPMLHRGLEQFIATARAAMPADSWIGFQTNGQLLSPRRAASLVEAGIDRIAISADAVADDQLMAIRDGAHIGSIAAGARAVHEAARRSGRAVSLGLEFVAMRGNLDQLPELVRWAARHEFAFLIVTHMLPYDSAMANQAAFSPATDQALAIYRTWRDRALADDVDLRRYLGSFMSFTPSAEASRAIEYVRRMVADATSQGISLKVADLLAFDEQRLERVEATFAKARELATEAGIDLRLPATVPTQVRHCDFVEEGSAFVSWDGDLHPCYFLWHGFQCHLAGLVKTVRPRTFGNAGTIGILDAWNGADWAAFRDAVTRYQFPFCYDCNLAMCDYVQDGDFEQDCHVGNVPCAACLWCTGPFQCLR